VIKFESLYSVKTNLSKLIEELVPGDELVITNHGNPVAKLVAYKEKPALGAYASELAPLSEIDWHSDQDDLFKDWLASPEIEFPK
jgi:prevent-host-death family protein